MATEAGNDCPDTNSMTKIRKKMAREERLWPPRGDQFGHARTPPAAINLLPSRSNYKCAFTPRSARSSLNSCRFYECRGRLRNCPNHGREGTESLQCYSRHRLWG